MNQRASLSTSNGLTRYHSAPSFLLATLAEFHEGDTFHIPSDPNLRAQALLGTLFSDDFAPAWPQQQHDIRLPTLGTSSQMLQPYPVPVPGEAQNQLGSEIFDSSNIAQELPASVSAPCKGGQSSEQTPSCDSMEFGGSNTICRDNFGSASISWNRHEVLNNHPLLINSTPSCLQSLSQMTAAVPSSWLPATPPKSGLLRHSSSPATFLNQLSGEFRAGGKEERHKLRNRMIPSLTRSYELPESCLRFESSDENDEEPPGQNPLFRKRYRSDNLHQLSGGLLPCNTTPCQARAKRGFATHPRSISERLRRTRISEGIKKLQELVPNIDKQMNTADMLDEAVEYIKLLQKQVQDLSKNGVISSDIKP
ncbi:hypothetical protein O6H91_Y305900 [Diphasiastrum complanatum]|nr:hypothetical protein O6H91_Y305900 [Diphasiastrum complanatum]